MGGVIVGVAVSALALATASILAPLPAGSPAAAPLPLVDEDRPAAGPSTDEGADASATALSPALSAQTDDAPIIWTDAEGPGPVDTVSASLPATFEVSPSLEGPPLPGLASSTPEVEAPVLPTPLGPAPAVPRQEAGLSVATATSILAPAEPVLPDAATTDPIVLDPATDDAAAPGAERLAVAPLVDDSVTPLDPAATADTWLAAVTRTEPPVWAAPAGDLATASAASDGPSVERRTAGVPRIAQAPLLDGAQAMTHPTMAPPAVEIAAAPPPASHAPQPLVTSPEDATPDQPAGLPSAEPAPAPVEPPGRVALTGGDGLPVVEAGSTVRINRPRLDTAPTQETRAEAQPAVPALHRFAAAFEPPAETLPLLAVVLIDNGTLAGAEDVVASLPFAVSIALDPAREGAAETMAKWRAKGVEVLAIAALPSGAQPVDAAVNIEAIVRTLPEAVAVLDMGSGGLGGGSAVGPQVLARLAQDGRGALIPGGGLGTGLREAEAAGVPALAVLRDIDGAGQDRQVVGRFLDDAARRAEQEGRIVVLGRLRPETLTALALWGNARRAQGVTMAPVSAALRAD